MEVPPVTGRGPTKGTAMVRGSGPPGPADQYTGVSAAIGAGVGIVVGVLIGGWAIPVAMSVGVGVGVALGAAIDGQHADRTAPRTH